jgi:hypothetical protein
MTLVEMPGTPLKPHQRTEFSSSIQALVNQLERDTNTPHSIPLFCRRFQVKRRRLYDVINVFTAIGCATRQGVDALLWHGRDRALEFMKETSGEMEVQNPEKTLCELFPTEKCVGLPTLTVAFVLLFGAMQVETLDLREVSSFFSRETARYKSTLCKLYQITLILSAIGVMQRTVNVCEVKIQSPFKEGLAEVEYVNPLALERLLNRPGKPGDATTKRMSEFRRYSKEHLRGQVEEVGAGARIIIPE